MPFTGFNVNAYLWSSRHPNLHQFVFVLFCFSGTPCSSTILRTVEYFQFLFHMHYFGLFIPDWLRVEVLPDAFHFKSFLWSSRHPNSHKIFFSGTPCSSTILRTFKDFSVLFHLHNFGLLIPDCLTAEVLPDAFHRV